MSYFTRNRSDYKLCPFCGCTLDLYEECDCKQEIQKPAAIKPVPKVNTGSRQQRGFIKHNYTCV